MKKWQVILAVLAVIVLIVVVAVAAWRQLYPYGDNNSDFPEGIFFLCGNPDCKAEFTLTVKQLGKHHEDHYGQPVPCPKCEATKPIRAEKCPYCGRFFPMERDPRKVECPHCKKTVNTGGEIK